MIDEAREQSGIKDISIQSDLPGHNCREKKKNLK
jgi:hypothetical protein